MRKVAAISITLALAFCLFGCGGKPSDVDQTTYDLAKESVQVGENYLAGKTSSGDAYSKLDSIYEELDAYTPDNSTSHTIISSSVLNMRIYLDPLLGTPNEEKLKKSLESIKEQIS